MDTHGYRLPEFTEGKSCHTIYNKVVEQGSRRVLAINKEK